MLQPIKLQLLTISITLIVCWSGLAQDTSTQDIKALYGIDYKNKIVLCHNSLITSRLIDLNETGEFLLDDKNLKIISRPNAKQTNYAALVVHKKDSFQVFTTNLPIIKIDTEGAIPNEPKIMARFTYGDATQTISSYIGIELRGNTALTYPKKSYDMEFRIDSVSDESQDFALAGLRSDDDWILNGMYNEPLMLRSKLANALWLDLRGKNPAGKNAKYGTQLEYTELFINGEYQGLYGIMEQIDRKQLGLKKMAGDTVNGELYKANASLMATSFKASPEYKNALPNWGGFQMKYPYEDYTAHWDDLAEFVGFVVTADSEEFASEIESRLDVDNAIDYYLLMNLMRATDNWSKNYFLARQTQNSPYYFIAWDLDGVLGNFGGGTRIKTTERILSNGLFDRLIKENPVNFRSRLQVRWQELRASVLSDASVSDRINALYNSLQGQHIYLREELIWNHNHTPSQEVEFIIDWYSARGTYLDNYFNALD